MGDTFFCRKDFLPQTTEWFQTNCRECCDGKTCGSIYCVQIKTGEEGSNDGYLEFTIAGKNTPAQEYKKGTTVSEECFEEPVEVTVKNPKNDAWAGTVKFSTDFKQNWFDMPCTNCGRGKKLNAKLVVDGNGDSDDQGEYTCLKEKTCTLKFPKVCMQLKTGGNKDNNGQVSITVSDKKIIDNRQLDKAETLVRCAAEAGDVKIQGETQDAWAGTIKAAWVQKGADWQWLETTCPGCEESPEYVPADREKFIVADKNSDSKNQGKALCHDGNSCSLAFSGLS